MEDHQYDRSFDSLSLPTNSVVGILNDPDGAASVAELRKGNFLIAAPAEDDAGRDLVLEVLELHGGHFINHCTDWTVSGVEE